MRRKYYYVIVAALMLSLAGCVSDKQDNQRNREISQQKAVRKIRIMLRQNMDKRRRRMRS